MGGASDGVFDLQENPSKMIKNIEEGINVKSNNLSRMAIHMKGLMENVEIINAALLHM